MEIVLFVLHITRLYIYASTLLLYSNKLKQNKFKQIINFVYSKWWRISNNKPHYQFLLTMYDIIATLNYFSLYAIDS